MPSDSMKKISANPFPRLTNEEKIDLKRARGQVSCAECRRLKLKCDKGLPCGSCVRRGRSSICPNGTTVPAAHRGSRHPIPDIEQLNQKIAEMGQRIRQLEDALAILQANLSEEPHPLLREELLAIKFGPKMEPPEDTHEEGTSLHVLTDALGTLTIGNHGLRYFGSTAGSEMLLMAGSEMEHPSIAYNGFSPVSLTVSRLSNSFPFGPEGDWDVEQSLEILYSFLPPQPRAWSLCEAYMEHGSWPGQPLDREDLIDDILTPVYKFLRNRKDPDLLLFFSTSAHKLAVLYMIFARGALVDLTLPAYSAEAENYHSLARAALSLRSVFAFPDLWTIRALALMAVYHSNGGSNWSIDGTWSIITLAVNLSQSVGLHRDGARWDLDTKTVNKRRALFWEIFTLDAFFSLSLGRPPSISLSHVDCELPTDNELTYDDNGHPLIGYNCWKWSYTKDIFSAVAELMSKAKVPEYETILDMDRKVRERPLPSHLNFSSREEALAPGAYMRLRLLPQYRATTMLCIHRYFFVQAMLHYPHNPLLSPYAPSFLAAHRSASAIITMNVGHFNRFPELCVRWWSLWSGLFSAAIVVGAIATRLPSTSMASRAFAELTLAVDIFEKGAIYSRRARNGLAVLRRLRERAARVHGPRPGANTGTSALPSMHGGPPDTFDLMFSEDELAIFGGQAKVLVSKLAFAAPASSRVQTDAAPVHPSLMEFLSSLPAVVPGPAAAAASPPPPPPPPPPSIGPDPAQDPPAGSDCAAEYFGLWEPSMFVAPTPPAAGAHSPAGVGPGGGDAEGYADLLVAGDAGMDLQWADFVRDAGLLDAGLGAFAFAPAPGDVHN